MNDVVFIGPTMDAADCREILDARYLPPARYGDVYRAAITLEPRTIAIVDGYFNQVPSVWHKEILWAMHRGIRVYGAASMGALRAAELGDFGMQGVGTVFNAYREGRFPPYEDAFENDDEVAIVHGPATLGYRCLSTALVDVRATLAAAARAGVIRGATRDALVELCRRRFYAERGYDTLFDDARELDGLSTELEALKAWIPSHQVSVKRDDATRLLERLASRGDEPAAPVAFRFEQTTLWDRAVNELSCAPAPPSPVFDELRLLGDDFFALRELVLDEAFGDGAEAAPADSDEAVRDAWYRDALLGGSIAGYRDAAPAHWLTERMLARLADSGDLENFKRRADDKARVLARRIVNVGALDELERLQLMDWYFSERLGREMPDDIDAYAASLGGLDGDGFHELVLREYVYSHPDD